jgi:hypothetical protein
MPALRRAEGGVRPENLIFEKQPVWQYSYGADPAAIGGGRHPFLDFRGRQMNLNDCISRLASNAQGIRSLVDGVTAQQAGWKPDANSWSVLEVVNHLLDEEKQDFRVRLEYTLFRPGDPWPAIDPQGWVTERAYNQRDLEESLANFLHAREDSLAWLRTLREPNWDAAYQTSLGPLTAGDLLAAWVAHDLLHMRQLVELHWAYVQLELAPYHTFYAGDW